MRKGLKYDDLNALQKSMTNLVFEFELLKVQLNNEYEKELWQMDTEEMTDNVPKYHKSGNELFKDGKVEEAEKNYASAISCLKHLQLKERPGTGPWSELDQKQIPLLLNHAQCKLMKSDYQECITNCTEVLNKIDGADNVKALFKRGKAHAILLNERECHADFSLALKLDPSVKVAIYREIQAMEKQMKVRDRKLSSYLKGMFD